MTIKEFLLTDKHTFTRTGSINAGLPKYLRNNFEERLKEIYKETHFLSSESRIGERIYCILNDIKTNKKCLICGQGNVVYESYKIGYYKTCSRICTEEYKTSLREQGLIKVPKHTEEFKRKQSERQKGKNNSAKKLEVRNKISKTLFGRNTKRKGVSMEEEYGSEKAQEIKLKMSKAKKGKTYEEISGIKKAKERKLNLKGGGRFNHYACEFFDYFDERLNTNGQYGNKGKEYCTKDRYFLDYVNNDLKLIMEWDESYHFTAKGQLKKKDQERQNKIMSSNELKDYTFLRIKQNKNIPFDEIFTNINIQNKEIY